MKQRIIYIAIAAIIGVGVGYLLFGTSNSSSMEATMHDHTSDSKSQIWTCSMHPQIMQPEPGDCPICGMDLIPAEAGVSGLAPEQFTMTDNALALANIQTTVVGADEAGEDSTISLSGKIAVNEEAVAVQASYFDGRIERLNVNYEGQEVRRGQLLATIYSPELVAAQQELLTAASLKESQPQLYQAVRNKLKLWKLSENQINTIENSGKVTEYFPIYATVSGTVSEVMSAEGDYVMKGQPIAKVSNLNTVWAEFDAYESQLSQFERGQTINITTNAYPNKEFDGKISFIDPMLNSVTRTVTVRATLNNKDNLFKPGMFVKGSIETGKIVKSELKILVPSTAVMWTGERSLVYVKVKSDEPIFEMREVMLGTRIGEQIEVISGLDSGEEIVTNGTFTVDAAAQLRGKKSMMNKTGGKTMTGHEGHTGMQAGSATLTPPLEMKMQLPQSFQTKFEEALPLYLKLKDAFVSSNPDEVSTFAKSTSKKMKAIEDDNLDKMVKSHLIKSIEMLEAIGTNDKLENQRAHFVILNENMVNLAMNLKNVNDSFYVQKCPMANNNKGAIWISNQKEIRNPYYGDAMLTCGSVIDSLQ